MILEQIEIFDFLEYNKFSNRDFEKKLARLLGYTHAEQIGLHDVYLKPTPEFIKNKLMLSEHRYKAYLLQYEFWNDYLKTNNRENILKDCKSKNVLLLCKKYKIKTKLIYGEPYIDNRYNTFIVGEDVVDVYLINDIHNKDFIKDIADYYNIAIFDNKLFDVNEYEYFIDYDKNKLLKKKLELNDNEYGIFCINNAVKINVFLDYQKRCDENVQNIFKKYGFGYVNIKKGEYFKIDVIFNGSSEVIRFAYESGFVKS